MNLSISGTSNHILTSGYNRYDAAGDQLGIPGKTFQYDAESRIKTVNNGSYNVARALAISSGDDP